MARPSSRPAIIDAAIRVAGREPITTVTVDAVAVEAGLTKAGVLYHFATKEALLLALQEHLAAEWETMLERAAGGPAERVPLPRRAAAYARVAAETASRAELVLLLEASANPALSVPMRAVLDRWVPPIEAALEDPSLWPYTLVRLAADGLWSSVEDHHLSVESRRRVADAIATIAEPGGDEAGEPADG